MDFLDNSGHIFSLPSYTEEPIGYEFEENEYVFWLDSLNTNYLSVNNYYIKTINSIIYYDSLDNKSLGDLIDIEVSINSNKFWLVKPQDIQDMVCQNKSITDYINISNKENVVKKLTNDDLLVVSLSGIEDSDDGNATNWPRTNVAIMPIYIISTSDEIGTWMTNVLIHIKNKTDNYGNNIYDSVEEFWCPITIGAIYEEENEVLMINGTNMGVDLPKDILKAVYQSSFLNEVFDEELYNEKLKEYLINYMGIKGEIGNYNSIEKSLKWFGYGDKISLSKLLKTDNEFKFQYVHDYFNISTDIIKSFKYFTNKALITLRIKENDETDKIYKMNLKEDFWGEGKPIMKDIFDSLETVEVGLSNDKWSYIKPYYDFSFYELGFKLSCLKYYFEKYFLPIHIKIHSASITHKVFANDIKFNNHVYQSIYTESPISLEGDSEVEFIGTDIRYFTDQIHFVDDQFNEFESYNENLDVYKIHDTCLNIPIKFKSFNKLYNCVLLLEKELSDIERINTYKLSILNHSFNPFLYDLHIYEKTTGKSLDLSKYLFNFYLDNYVDEFGEYIEGYDAFREYLKSYFKIFINSKNDNDEIDDTCNLEIIFNVSLNKNFYCIDLEKICQNLSIALRCPNDYENIYNKIKNILSPYSYQDNNHENENLYALQKTDIEIITEDWYIYIPSYEKLNVNPMHRDSVEGKIVICPKVNVVLMFDQVEIDNLTLENIRTKNTKSLKSYMKINYNKATKLIYESHFSFIQNPNDESTIYKCFVLYPKILNKINANYYVNKNFTLRLLVNNKWYRYDFKSKMSDIQLEFGSIKYKYWATSDNYYSRFSQLLDIKPSEEENAGYVQFNSFMHEPKFVDINSINYLSDIEEYLMKNNLNYIDQEKIDILYFDKYIVLGEKSNTCKIYFSNLFFDELDYIDINVNYIDEYDELYVVGKDKIFASIKEEKTYKVIEGIGKRKYEKLLSDSNKVILLDNEKIRISKKNDHNLEISLINNNGDANIVDQSFKILYNIYNTNTNIYQKNAAWRSCVFLFKTAQLEFYQSCAESGLVEHSASHAQLHSGPSIAILPNNHNPAVLQFSPRKKRTKPIYVRNYYLW